MKSHLLEELEQPRNATHEHPKKTVGMCVGPVFSAAPTFLGERRYSFLPLKSNLHATSAYCTAGAV